jgi:hypothetical protein
LNELKTDMSEIKELLLRVVNKWQYQLQT